jgi:hypothetical protein
MRYWRYINGILIVYLWIYLPVLKRGLLETAALSSRFSQQNSPIKVEFPSHVPRDEDMGKSYVTNRENKDSTIIKNRDLTSNHGNHGMKCNFNHAKNIWSYMYIHVYIYIHIQLNMRHQVTHIPPSPVYNTSNTPLPTDNPFFSVASMIRKTGHLVCKISSFHVPKMVNC